MRPGEAQSGVIAVLDTRAECKVVLDAINDRHFEAGTPDIDPSDVMNPAGESLEHRFRHEARQPEELHLEQPPHIHNWETWKMEPEFRVLPNDVSFVMRAAGRILNKNKNSFFRLAWNDLTGRTEAARQILDFFSDEASPN